MNDATRAPRTRIGVLGGAFDPPHLAHQRLAQEAINQLQLHELLVVPSGKSLHRLGEMCAAHHRCRMAEMNFEGLGAVRVLDYETQRGGVSYTYDTLIRLHAEYPNSEFFLILGADQARVFDTWHRWRDILGLCTLALAMRAALVGPLDEAQENEAQENEAQEINALEHAQLGAVEFNQYPWHNSYIRERAEEDHRLDTNPTDPLFVQQRRAVVALALQMPRMDVSATRIRQAARAGEDFSQWLDPKVHNYILRNSLYRSSTN